MVVITQNVMGRGNRRDFQTKYQLANAPLILNIKPAFQSDWDSCHELFKWNESPGGTAEHGTKMLWCNIWLMLKLKQTWNEAVSWRQSLKQDRSVTVASGFLKFSRKPHVPRIHILHFPPSCVPLHICPHRTGKHSCSQQAKTAAARSNVSHHCFQSTPGIWEGGGDKNQHEHTCRSTRANS